jgi:aminoglycoside 2'-N-acetyltransferase I
VPAVRRVASAELSRTEIGSLRALFAAAWDCKGGVFTEEDWHHACGGEHFVIDGEGGIVGHASVVPRHLVTASRSLSTGYVEAVATLPRHQGRGFASAIMREVTESLKERYELGALDTGIPSFYERFGWRRWTGPTSVLPPPGTRWALGSGPIPTPEEDDAVMVRITPSSPRLDLNGGISCDWREGDVW